MPRTDCAKCGFRQVEVPWARPDSGFTLLFETRFLMPARETAISEAAETLGIQEHPSLTPASHYGDKTHAEVDRSELRRVGLDETSRCPEHPNL